MDKTENAQFDGDRGTRARPRENPKGKGEFWYRVHALSLRSSFELPELRAIAPLQAPPDIAVSRIHRCDVHLATQHGASSSDQASGSSELVVLPKGVAKLSVPAVGDFEVKDGREILLRARRHVDPSLVQLYTIGSGLGLALEQRDALVLHGASAVRDGRAVLLLGPSGVGKSTLAAALAAAGFEILGDDTIALWQDETRANWRVFPSGVALKLWGDALEALGVSAAGLRPVAAGVGKFYLPVGQAADASGYSVDSIVLLRTQNGIDRPEFSTIELLEAIQGITENLYRPMFVEALGKNAIAFTRICSLAAATKVTVLSRPPEHATLPILVEMLDKDLRRQT